MNTIYLVSADRFKEEMTITYFATNEEGIKKVIKEDLINYVGCDCLSDSFEFDWDYMEVKLICYFPLSEKTWPETYYIHEVRNIFSDL